MKKDTLTVKELAAELQMEPQVDPAGLSQGGDPRAVVVAHGTVRSRGSLMGDGEKTEGDALRAG